jgi:hypothetical protein
MFVVSRVHRKKCGFPSTRHRLLDAASNIHAAALYINPADLNRETNPAAQYRDKSQYTQPGGWHSRGMVLNVVVR